MRTRTTRPPWPIFVLIAAACGGNATGPGGEDGGSIRPAVFTVSPLRLEDITGITPIGNLAPPGHTLPTEHAYFWFEKDWTPGAPLPRLAVFAPASGTISRVMVIGPDNNYRLDVEVNGWLTYYLILVDLNHSTYKKGRKVTAGEQLGVTYGGANSLDVGVINEKLKRTGFARPERYGPETRHIDSPFRYFAEPLRSAIYAKVLRQGPDKDGTIEVDVPGTLAGAWFRDDVPIGQTGGAAWSRALVFAPDANDPTAMRISIGNGFSISGLYGIHPGATPFSSVTPAGGPVGYRLDALDNSSDPWRGVLRVEMPNATTLHMQFFPGSTNLNEPMTTARTRYLR